MTAIRRPAAALGSRLAPVLATVLAGCSSGTDRAVPGPTGTTVTASAVRTTGGRTLAPGTGGRTYARGDEVLLIAVEDIGGRRSFSVGGTVQR